MTPAPGRPDEPRRTIEPLSPPAGRFDAVMGAAKARRYRRATAVCSVTGVFLAGIFGGLAMGGVSGVQQRVETVAQNIGLRVPSTPSPSHEATSTQASPTRSSSGKTRRPQPSTVTVPVTIPPQAGREKVRGRVVDPTGAPVVGMFVYTSVPGAKSFVPSASPADVTGANGSYDVPCTGGAVLLTPWQLNVPLGRTADGHWAATFVSDPVCSRKAAPTVTSVEPGVTVQGNVRTEFDCATEQFPLWVWLDGNRAAAVRLSGLTEGDQFRVSGLPARRTVLGARGHHTPVPTLVGIVNQDVTFPCSGIPTPTESPSPQPTPSETLTPLPSATSPTPTDTSTQH
ncbi:MAG TPA: hypothetical protein VH857_02105 [Actinomycetes bacterium]|jgi:hypothetical protein|nr:hypothetical protein [Actinomycetes bacterium]